MANQKGGGNITNFPKGHTMAKRSDVRLKKDGSPYKQREPVDPNESNSDRFLRVGGRRVAEAIQALDLVGQLTGASYEYTPDQARKAVDAIYAAYESMTAKFTARANGQSPAKASTFSF